MHPLRPFQEEALQALDSDPRDPRHVLCVSPTGSGKSLIYEKAALRPGRRTLLMTPLVALARQQFVQLQKLGIPVSLGAGRTRQPPPSSKTGAWIVSPEMLNSPSHLNSLKNWQPSFLAVDECHCLWDWGSGFRPAFLLIPDLLRSLQIPKSLWLTATLPYEARKYFREILPQPLIEVGKFDLPERLKLIIHRVPWEWRLQTLVDWLRKLAGPGIIFVPTRETTLKISRLTKALGMKTLTYHAGMSTEERRNIENSITHKQADVVIATSAFGMGMDYSHLRYVIQWQAPTSLLSLVQTVGRVGRGKTSEDHAIVLWDHDDFRLLEWTLGESERRRSELVDLMKFLETHACRRALLKAYFDRSTATAAASCQMCDFCLSSTLAT